MLRPTGAAAWMWRRIDQTGVHEIVSRSPRCGEPATLTENGDAGTLRRNGRRVVWREAGVKRSAPIC